MNYHLAILSKGWIDLILQGSKTIESRFTKIRCAPFRKVSNGDIVYMKKSGGLVKGMFRVAEVETFEDLTEKQIKRIDGDAEYVTKIFGQTVYTWRYRYKWRDAKHATLIHIRDFVKFDEPYSLPFKKRDQRAWVVLEHPLHKCMECGDRYLLEVYETPDGELIHGSEHFCPSCHARECVSPDEEVVMG